MNNLVLRQDSHGTATLTLNRPEKLNALTKDVFEALEEHIVPGPRNAIDLDIPRGPA